jgi:hypothetical protein
VPAAGRRRRADIPEAVGRGVTAGQGVGRRGRLPYGNSPATP